MESRFDERLAALTPAQRALFELRTRARRQAARTIPPRAERNFCPLSLDQERLWFIQQLDPSSPLYNIYSAVRFKGPLDVAAIAWSLNEIVRRHEIMRTSFAEADGRPVQVIAPELVVPVPVVDLTALDRFAREREAERLASQEVRRSVPLTRLPLFRVLLVRVAEEDYVCTTVLHHIITDWVSFHLFDRELAALYAARRAGRPSPLEPPQLQYADFAAWQRQRLDSNALAEHVEYWRAQLEGAPLVLDLPLDRPRPPMQGGRGRREPLVISKADSDRARALAQQESATLFMLLLTAFQALLSRVAAQDRLIVGSPIASRDLPELAGALGFFLNQLVLDVDLAGDPTFRSALGRVRERAVGAYAHADMPFGALVQLLQPARDLSRMPVTQAVFLFLEPETQGAVRFDELAIEPYTVDGLSSKFDMTLSLWDGETGFAGWLEYNSDVFHRTSICRFKEQFRTLLHAVLEDPDRPLSTISTLPPHEAHQVRVEWPAGPAAPDGQLPLHACFERQAARTPDAAAILMAGERLTYAELNARANRLARYLRHRGAGAERVIGLCLARTPDLYAGLLAILKSGAACLPLDPALPEERIAALVRDARALLVVSDDVLERDREAIARESDANLADRPEAGAAAYVMYTSGSTGAPKGVVVPHAVLARHCRAAADHYELSTSDKVLQFTGVGFDPWIEQCGTAFLAGAAIVARGAGVPSGADLARRCREESITVVNLTPSVFAAVMEDLRGVDSLRLLILGGDALPPGIVEPWRAQADRVRVLNAYGPTEAAITSTLCEALPALSRHGCTRWVPIGRAVAGRTVYVLDPAGNPVPIGTAGELYIGGDLLARGYLHQPGLTARSFVPDPFGAAPGARLYRTGDRVRMLNDGQLEFLGRDDLQVKVRGCRVELGEIEACLSQHPAVRAAAVAARQDETTWLAAFVELRDPAGADSVALHAFVRERLPEYMVPSAVVVVDALPILPSGKVDRHALSLAAPERPRARHTPPRTPTEQGLVEVWKDVLRVAQVGVHDNFFALGGDSILSMQIVARAARKGIRLHPRHLFDCQTIEELARVAGSAERAAAVEPSPPGPVPLTPIQRWFFDQRFADPHHYNQSILLEVPASLEPAAVGAVTRALVDHHEALRLRFRRGDDGWTARIVTAGAPAFSYVDLASCPPEGRSAALTRAAGRCQERLDLEHGPLLRVALFGFGDAPAARLLVVAHHLIVDAVSWGILLDDLHVGLTQWRRGEEVRFARTAAYGECAARAAQAGPAYRVRRDVAIETGRSPGPASAASARHVEVAVPAGVTSALGDGPLDAPVLDAVARAVRVLAPGGGLTIDVEGHGRDVAGGDVDASRVVGWFTTLRSIRADDGEDDDGPPGGSSISFNYLGRLERALPAESPFRPAVEPIGDARSPRAHRAYPIEVEARITGATLGIVWTFSEHRHDRPTIERLAQSCLRELESPHTRLVRTPGRPAPEPPLVPVSREAPLPLSFAQESFWTLEQYLPGTPLFSTPIATRLTGRLDRAAFRRSIRAIVDRHELLRTTFEAASGRPRQVVHARAALPFRTIDVTALTAARRAEALERIALDEALRPFDLAAGPLLRIVLVAVADDEHALLFTTHHIIADAWSTGVFLAELSRLYRALTSGAACDLPVLPIQYADYASWQRRAFDEGCLDHQLAFWRRQLEGPLPLLALGSRRARHDDLDVTSAVRAVTLPGSLLDGLRARSRAEGVSLFTLLLAALGLLVHRRTGAGDVRIATMVANRARPELEHLLGLLVNTVVLRMQVTAESTRAQVLQRVRNTVADALHNQDVPFDRVVELVEREQAVDRADLSPVLFLMQNAGVERLDLPGLAAEALREDSASPFALTTFDWIVTAEERRAGLALSVRYKPRVFEDEEIARVLRDFGTELGEWARNVGGKT